VSSLFFFFFLFSSFFYSGRLKILPFSPQDLWHLGVKKRKGMVTTQSWGEIPGATNKGKTPKKRSWRKKGKRKKEMYGAQKLNPTSGKNWKEPRGFLIIEEYTQQL